MGLDDPSVKEKQKSFADKEIRMILIIQVQSAWTKYML